ncbi:uncharacterized protein SPSC_01947 [Sporisorium scitamineum]|uniref:DDE Tnp4 domain-containing protein n=1 Tax=Sporisorium scitamineum TaxID=49012 RepID=A0A127ZB21_9BASI|nr:uncharacterized protein SPSC_01947 [Sporisorium scitamineum]
MIRGLCELNDEVVTFATDDEREKASQWVIEKSGVEEWGRGWLVADDTRVPVASVPALNAREHHSYKSKYSFNIALVFLPHSLRIVESVVGHPGRSHDSRVWASGNGITAKPRLHLDEGEFVWVDAGYGFSSYTVGPFRNDAAKMSKDIRFFNHKLTRIRTRAEHGIAYLKNRFQCLKGYRGNLYREEDHRKAALTIQACIIAHNFASRYDRPDDVADYLQKDFPDYDATERTSAATAYYQATEPSRIIRRANQGRYKQEVVRATQGMSQHQLDRYRKDAGLDLREEVFTALFQSFGRPFSDTSVASRRKSTTKARLLADQQRRQRYNEAHSEAWRRRQSAGIPSVRSSQLSTGITQRSDRTESEPLRKS